MSNEGVLTKNVIHPVGLLIPEKGDNRMHIYIYVYFTQTDRVKILNAQLDVS